MTSNYTIFILIIVTIVLIGIISAITVLSVQKSTDPEAVHSSEAVVQSSAKVNSEGTGGECTCFRGGDSVLHYDADGVRKNYDEGFCGRCIDGIVYGCPTSECAEDCTSLLYSGPLCNQCNGNKTNIHCIQKIQDVENKKIA